MALAEVEDIQVHLPPNVVVADDLNTDSVLVSVERYIKAYMAKVVATAGWTSPASTPATIREIAAMLAASKLYFNSSSATSLDVDERNFGELLYQRAIELLHGIVDGTVDIDGDIDTSPGDVQSNLSFWPDDTAERSFTTDMEFA